VTLLEPRKYSERLGVIDPGQLFEVAEMFELGEVISAEAMAGGLFGQNLALTTTEGDFVLRGNPHGHVQLTKERTGEAIRDAAEDRERVALARATGEALAELHDVVADRPGPYDAQLDDFIEIDDFADWALHRFEHWRNACRAVDGLSTEAELWLDQLIEECAPALAEPFDPVLVHHDFKYGNLNFEPTADGFESSGVFDLFEAYFGDGEEDLVRTLWLVGADERRGFVDAYTSYYPLRPGARERLALYAVCDWLVIWEYHRRHGILPEDTLFMERVGPIVANARAVASVR
jgi:hygromycin-B 7''-O-kinase